MQQNLMLFKCGQIYQLSCRFEILYHFQNWLSWACYNVHLGDKILLTHVKNCLASYCKPAFFGGYLFLRSSLPFFSLSWQNALHPRGHSRHVVFMEIFSETYFQGLQNWLQEQCKVNLHGNFRSNLIFQECIFLAKNKLHAKITRFTLYEPLCEKTCLLGFGL